MCRTVLYRILLTASLIVFVAVVAGCRRNLCTEAAALYTECTGQYLAPLENCDEVAAEFILAQDCQQFGFGKGDGSGCPSTVGDCPHTLKLRQETIARVPKVPSVVLFVVPSETSDSARVVVIQDPSSRLQDGAKMSTSALEETLAKTGAAVQSWFSVVSAGTEIRVSEADKSYFVRCKAVETTTQTVGPRKQSTTHVEFTVGSIGEEDKSVPGPGSGEAVLLDGLLAAKNQLSFRHGTGSYVLEVDALTASELKGRVSRCASIPCTAGGQVLTTDNFTCELNLATPDQRAAVPCTLAGGALALWYQHTTAAGCSATAAATPATQDNIEVSAPIVEAISPDLISKPTYSVTVAEGKVIIVHGGASLNAADANNTIQVVLDQSDAGKTNGVAGTLRAYEGSTQPKENAQKGYWHLTVTVGGLSAGKYAVKLYGPQQNGALSQAGTTEVLHDGIVDVPPSSASTPAPESETTCPPFVRVRAFGAAPTAPAEPTTPAEPTPPTSATVDLVPKIKLARTTDEATGKVTIEGEVTNQGTADSVATTLDVTVYNSSNSSQKLPPEQVPVLAAKATHPWTREVTLDPGTYKVTVELANQATSTKTINTEFTVPPRTTKAKLTVTMQTPAIDATTGKVSITGAVCNQGSAATPDTTVEVVLYDGNKSRLQAKTLSVPALPAPNKCHSWLAVEFVLQPARYSVTATADPSNTISEKGDQKEASVTFDVPARTAAAQVDLQLAAVTVQPIGSEISVAVQVCNRSTASAPAFRVGLFLTAAQPQCGQQAQGYLAFDGLAPNQCDTHTSDAIAPGVATTVWALADADCKISDPDKTNNAKAYQAATLTASDDDGGCHIGGGDPSADGVVVALVLALLLGSLRRRRR